MNVSRFCKQMRKSTAVINGSDLWKCVCRDSHCLAHHGRSHTAKGRHVLAGKRPPSQTHFLYSYLFFRHSTASSLHGIPLSSEEEDVTLREVLCTFPKAPVPLETALTLTCLRPHSTWRPGFPSHLNSPSPSPHFTR